MLIGTLHLNAAVSFRNLICLATCRIASSMSPLAAWAQLDFPLGLSQALQVASHGSLECGNGGFLVAFEQHSPIAKPFQVCGELLDNMLLFTTVLADMRKRDSRLVVENLKDG